MSIKFAIECVLEYELLGPCEFIFCLQIPETPHQTIFSENLIVDGAQIVGEYKEPTLGNRLLRVSGLPGVLKLDYTANIVLSHQQADPGRLMEHAVKDLPVEVLSYLLPSRYCQSDQLLNFAIQEFGHLSPGYLRVQSVCNWVHQYVRFIPGTTQSSTSALEILFNRTGVCRDFTHLTIALLRALSIPARFVAGYDYGADPSLGPTDFHAYVEAYIENRWYIFDPSGLCPRPGLVRIATGRDAADCAFATTYGVAKYKNMLINIQPYDMKGEAFEIEDNLNMALSTAGCDNNPEWLPYLPTMKAIDHSVLTQ